MPCRDYESDNGWSRIEQYKEQCDKLARIACAAMEELVKQGKEDFLVLKNPEVAEWWVSHVKADRAEKARVAEKERQERVKAEALSRLTDEEKELLGLKKPTVKKHRKYDSISAKKELTEYNIETWEKDQEEIEYLVKELNDTYLQITRGK